MNQCIPSAKLSSPIGSLRPVLRFHLRLCGDAHGVTVELEDSCVRIGGRPGDDILRLLDAADGGRTVEQLAALLGLDPAEAGALCHAMAGAGVINLLDGDDHTLINAMDFAAVCSTVFPTWKEQLFSHSLWQSLANGSCPHSIFAGWLLESYHFIEGVTVRLPTVIAFCREPSVRRHFARHFAEEYDHHHFFERALAAIGMLPEQVRAARPLPGTLAVLNHMRDCGRHDPLAYAACSGFLEATGSDRRRGHAFFTRLAQHFDPDGIGVIRPMAEHAALDEGYHHDGFLTKICGELGDIPRARADAALQAAKTLVETLEIWSSDIERHYRDASVFDTGIRRYRPIEPL